MRVALCAMIVLLSGCETTGYAFVGAGHSFSSGFEDIDETGLSGTFGVGVEFNDYVRCEFRHRSMASRNPEIVTNDANCIGTVYFWGP